MAPVWVIGVTKEEILSSVQLCVILQTTAYQAPLSMEFSRQEYQSGLPFPSLRDLPDPGWSPALQADSLPSELPGPLLSSISV